MKTHIMQGICSGTSLQHLHVVGVVALLQKHRAQGVTQVAFDAHRDEGR